MRSEEWGKIEELLDAALELEPTARQEFLDGLDSPDLRREVESLLACEKNTNGFLGAPALALSADFFDDDNQTDGRAGQQVGPFRIIREIGRGGMGAVFLAERADGQFEQKVALKVVRRSFADTDLARRFRQERQILASLNHPNIARLLDGGVSKDGEPFLAMEHVEGARIDAYADAHQLSTHERLRLFRQVCAAVQYAHQNLIIHRDLKPSNILVTADGVPKLLDFGIAKLLDAETDGVHTVTELGVMTPEYASPEQVRGQAVTTATDVYSLGVVLYELLAGRRPYRVKSRKPDEIVRVICEQEPSKPSEAVAGQWSVVSGQKQIAKNKGQSAGGNNERLTADNGRKPNPQSEIRNPKFLRGDLDNIVLMAMRKEPARRYASVAEFSEDIRRHIEGLPVIARKDTFKYRAEKFIKRNKVGVAAAAILLVTLLGGVIATAWQARRATAERDRARIEAAKSARINEFLQHVLGYSQVGWLSPNPKKKNISTIADALDEASRRAERELADQPEILAAVQFSLGQSYSGQGKLEAAAQHLRSSMENRRKVFGIEHPDTAQSMTALAEQLVFQSKFAEAETLSREAVAVYRRASERGEVNARWFAVALNVLGVSLGYKGEAQASEALLLEAVKVGANLTGEDRGMIAVIYANIGIQRGNQGDIDGAVEYLQKSIEEMRRLPDKPLSNLANNLSNLGSFMTIKGEHARAESLLREALDLNLQTVGEKHLFTVMSLIYLADNYCEQGDHTRALAEINRVLAIQSETLQEGHIDFARSWTILGKILTRMGKAPAGEDHLRRALALRVKSLKPGHSAIAGTQGALGECLTAQGRYAEAEPLLTESHKALEAKLGARDPRTQKAGRRLAALYEAWKKQLPPT